jgi:hypothetical protein
MVDFDGVSLSSAQTPPDSAGAPLVVRSRLSRRRLPRGSPHVRPSFNLIEFNF